MSYALRFFNEGDEEAAQIKRVKHHEVTVEGLLYETALRPHILYRVNEGGYPADIDAGYVVGGKFYRHFEEVK